MADHTTMKSCFVISPLGGEGTEVRQRSDDLFALVIKPALEPLGFSIIRVDRLSSPGNITRDILKLLLDSDLVIADLSDHNPNVMYELGVRHCVGKPVVIMTSQGERIPFDVAGLRVLVYEFKDPRSVLKVTKRLQEFVTALENSQSTDSPVLEAQAYKHFIAESQRATETPAAQQESVLKAVLERLGSLESRISQMSEMSKSTPTSTTYTRDVFIVHGHDGELKNELARLLEKLEFNPIILHEQADKGQTIIQKLQYEGSRVGFAFILHTPDDEGRKANSDSQFNPRSRQNVVFEHGMFVGRFSHSRVCAIVKHGVEIPSDLSGIVYKTIPAGGGIQSIVYEIVKELRAADYVIDANKL